MIIIYYNSVIIKFKGDVYNGTKYCLFNCGWKQILKTSDIESDDINYIINNRYIDAIDYCVTNEVLDTKIYNIMEHSMYFLILLI